MAFDPDAYLKQQPAAPAFDPDAYLGAGGPRVGMGDVQAAKSADPSLAPPPPTSAGESLMRGATQGLSFGWGDEIAGVRAKTGGNPVTSSLVAAIPVVGPILAGNATEAEAARPTLADLAKGDNRTAYERARDRERAENEAARQSHSRYYLAGEVGGAVAPTLLTGGTGLAAGGAKAAIPAAVELAAQGAAQGAGYSNADSARGLASDTSLGAALGLAGGAAGKGLGKVLGGVARKGAETVARAEEKAAGKAAQDVAEAINSLRGKYGKSREIQSRALEVLERLKGTGQLSPELQAQVDAAMKSPEARETIENLAKNYLDDLAGISKASTAAKGAFQEAAAAGQGAVEKRAAEILSAKTARQQVGERLKRYGPVAVGTILGTALGPGWGNAVGALAGAGTRPMIRALGRMMEHPAVASRVGRAVQTVGQDAAALAGGAGRMAPTAAGLSASYAAALLATLRERNINGGGATLPPGNEE